MVSRIVSILVVLALFGSAPVYAFDFNNVDIEAPGTWVVYANTCNTDIGFCLYPDSFELITYDTVIRYRQTPANWEYFYHDLFIFEMPDYFEDEEEEGPSERTDLLQPVWPRSVDRSALQADASIFWPYSSGGE